jgi:hypothetical protein
MVSIRDGPDRKRDAALRVCVALRISLALVVAEC